MLASYATLRSYTVSPKQRTFVSLYHHALAHHIRGMTTQLRPSLSLSPKLVPLDSGTVLCRRSSIMREKSYLSRFSLMKFPKKLVNASVVPAEGWVTQIALHL